MEAVSANGAGGETAALSAFGRQWGTAEMFALGRRANENPPKLYTFNPKGFRRDVVEFHPAYHDLMRASIAAGLHASTWTATGKRASPPAEAARAARYYMAAQVESGHLCRSEALPILPIRSRPKRSMPPRPALRYCICTRATRRTGGRRPTPTSSCSSCRESSKPAMRWSTSPPEAPVTVTVEQRISAAQQLSPEMCSLNMGSMNFALYPMARRHTRRTIIDPECRAGDAGAFARLRAFLEHGSRDT
jgi:hypothetical protein